MDDIKTLAHPTQENIQFRFVTDEDHETVGSYAYDTERETQAAEENERSKIDSGEWIVVGCIVEKRCKCCDVWAGIGDVWGIVIEPDDDVMLDHARWLFAGIE